MSNVNLNSAVIRGPFRSRSSSSTQPGSTNREQRAAAAAADSEDAVGTASPEDPLPVHSDYQDWDRHRRRGFDWDDLVYLSDYRTDANLADLTRILAAKSAFVGLFQDRNQVPTWYSTDRTLVENSTIAWLVSFLELWLVEGLGELGDIEDAIMEAHFCAHAYHYGDNADGTEAAACLRHHFEWMVALQPGRIIPLEDFAVVRVSRKPSSLLALSTVHAVFKSGVRLTASKFYWFPASCVLRLFLPAWRCRRSFPSIFTRISLVDVFESYQPCRRARIFRWQLV